MVLQTQTFNNFLAKSPPELTFLIASSSINEPMRYSPIFLYGEAAINKGYLLEAIVDKFQKIHKKPALYATAEQFINDFVQGMRENKKALFNQKYRSNALLVIDGIQLFAGRKLSQIELLRTLKEFQIQDRQIMLTADNHPYLIKKLDRDLKDFCQGGLMFEIR